MGRFLWRTWLPTLVMVVVTLGVAMKVMGNMWMVVSGITAAVVTPIFWWWLVGRKARPAIGWGVLAGGLAGATAHMAYPLPGFIWRLGINRADYAANAGLGAAGDAIILGMVLVSAIVTAAICAVAGIVIVLIEQRTQSA